MLVLIAALSLAGPPTYHILGVALAVAVAAACAWRLGAVRARRTLPARPPGSSTVPRAAHGIEAAPLPGDGAVTDDTIRQELVARYLAEARDAIGADVVTYWALDGEGEREPRLSITSAPFGAAPVEGVTPSPESLVRWAVQQRMPATNQDTDAGFFFTVPVGGADRPRGALAVYASDRRLVSRERARSGLPRYAARLAMLLDLLQDGRETRRYRGKAETLARVSERIQASTDLASLGSAICEGSLELSGATRAALVVWDDDGGAGRTVSLSTGHLVPSDFAVSADSFVGTACRERQRFTREVYRVSDLPLFAPGEPARRVGSIAVVPLQRDGAVLGAIAVEGERAGQITSVEGSLLVLVASVASAALRSVRQLEVVREQSVRDELTGLPNRRAFDAQLGRHASDVDRRGGELSLVVADIDHFKRVNDEFGHVAGDEVLAAVARAMGNAVRTIDLCARYGGEEFAVLLPQTRLAAAHEVAERLRRAVERVEIAVGNGVRLSVTVSLGVASYPTTASTAGALFASADRALYEAKRAGRNRVMSAEPTGVARAT